VRANLKRGMHKLVVMSLVVMLLISLSPVRPTQAADIFISNASFENGLTGWTNWGSTSAAYTQTGGYHGSYNLAHWQSSNYEVYTYRTITGLINGTYSLSAWVQSSGGQSSNIIEAKNFGGTAKSVAIPASISWTKVTITNIVVTNGQITLGMYSNASGGQWAKADYFVLDDGSGYTGTPGVAKTTMKVGGDITYRNLISDHGGQWAYADGTTADVLDILADHSFNLARIRIYNEPGNSVNIDGHNFYLQPGYQDLADAVDNAIAAKQRGMTLFISLHYSDFWTNPGLQTIPEDWKDYNASERMTAIWNYTVNVMNTFKNNNVTPEYISIGNEINNAVMGVNRGAEYYALLNNAYAAVKSVSPSTKVVIHLTNPDYTFYTQWVNDAAYYGLNYDIMGSSIYPFWTGWSISQMATFVTWLSNYSGKPIMICEAGYPWTLAAQRPGETTMIAQNYLDPDGPENYGATPAGQLRYMREFLRAMYNTGKVEAVSYWDPINIDVEGAGWVEGAYSQVEDTAFFDYGTPHKALPGLAAFYSY